MEQAIRDFPKQFAWKPKIENEEKWKRFEKFIFAGMGGSGLPGDIIKMLRPALELIIHKDYGLPKISVNVLNQSLVIANSYSGNTEETISVFQEAIQRNLSVAAISTGGKLLELAKKYTIPYIQIPDAGIQPRMGLGFSFRAVLKIMGEEEFLEMTNVLASELSPKMYEQKGKDLALKLFGKIPIIYSSTQNGALAFIWKLKFCETGKIPAFHNVLPELNHSEMNGFDVAKTTKKLNENFAFVFLKDREDHPRIQKRMEVLEKLYEERGLEVAVVELEGESPLEKVFSSLLFADWASYHTALRYGNDPERVAMVEEFKKLIEEK